MLLHFLHSLHPCNSAIAEEQKSALPATPANRIIESAYRIINREIIYDQILSGSMRKAVEFLYIDLLHRLKHFWPILGHRFLPHYVLFSVRCWLDCV